MKYLYGLLLLLWVAVNIVIKTNIDIISIASLLGLLCLFIFKEKFLDRYYMSIIFLAIVLFLSRFNSEFIILSGVTILDFTYWKKYSLGIISLGMVISVGLQNNDYSYFINLITAALLGFVLGEKDRNERNHIFVLDEERRLRYRLEETQNELIKSRMEVEHLTEIRERNRIAHEIHDSIGHSIAGIIFQIEAARRIIHKDVDRLEEILKLSSQKLSETLQLTRDTVYNIKPAKKVGLETLERIVQEINFCNVTFEHTGDFNTVSVSNMNILEANIREALTNATKYSRAKNIHIKVDVGKRNIRFYYKDDGIGCSNILDNIGVEGMRDRAKNAGGTFAIDGRNGFLIVSNLPVGNGEDEEGEKLEGLNC